MKTDYVKKKQCHLKKRWDPSPNTMSPRRRPQSSATLLSELKSDSYLTNKTLY